MSNAKIYWCHGRFTTVQTLAVNLLIEILINGVDDDRFELHAEYLICEAIVALIDTPRRSTWCDSIFNYEKYSSERIVFHACGRRCEGR